MDIIHHHFLTLDSTNNCAKRNFHLLDLAKLTVMTANEQTCGRGRDKRRWISPPRQNIYATFCFFIDKARPDIGNLGQLLALSVCKTLETFEFNPQLKWPNDIILSKKKVGGILCETVSLDDKLCVINGIGLNINMSREYLQQIDIPATSLMIEKQKTLNMDQIFHQLKDCFAEDLAIFIDKGFGPFVPRLKQLMEHAVNTKIRFHDQKDIVEGIFHSITDNGSLNLSLPSQQVKTFVSGEILYDTVSVS